MHYPRCDRPGCPNNDTFIVMNYDTIPPTTEWLCYDHLGDSTP